MARSGGRLRKLEGIMRPGERKRTQMSREREHWFDGLSDDQLRRIAAGGSVPPGAPPDPDDPFPDLSDQELETPGQEPAFSLAN